MILDTGLMVVAAVNEGKQEGVQATAADANTASDTSSYDCNFFHIRLFFSYNFIKNNTIAI